MRLKEVDTAANNIITSKWDLHLVHVTASAKAEAWLFPSTFSISLQTDVFKK